MAVFRSWLFRIAHEAWYPGFGQLLDRVKAQDEASINDLYEAQRNRLSATTRFAFSAVPYYRDCALRAGLEVDSVCTHSDLHRLPIVGRRELQTRRHDFLPDRRRNPFDRDAFTSGTTGTPLRYRLSRCDRAVGLALAYRGWGYAGYRLGDSMLLLAGRSLGFARRSLDARAADYGRHVMRLSAFDMNDGALTQYIAVLNRVRPLYIRGYPSALHVLARRVTRKGDLIWVPNAIFTTAEVLFPEVRQEIVNAFRCPVFDGYGLNDGGVSAFECEHHCGLHIDMERAILEVVDEQGVPVSEGTGRIIATTLTNYSMPLLRYDTGDVGELAQHQCSCGRQRPLLKAIHGRSTDVFVTPEGKLVHGWFFVYLLRGMSRCVEEFEVIQETLKDLTVLLVPTAEYDSNAEGYLREVIGELSAGWIVRVQTVESLRQDGGEKRKYVRSEVCAADEVQ